jgi:serine/threonine-protein kinase
VSGPAQPFRLDGTQLAGYLIHSLVGRGGMAYVYRAEDPRLGRQVALKVLAPELSTNEDFRRRFLRESRLAAALDHPNIIPIYDAGEADGLLYIAMRYVAGSDLKSLLTGGRRPDVRQLVAIFSQIAGALDAAHAHGLVHRDVKPANVLIAPAPVPQGHDHVYLTDFGITKRAGSLSGVTAAGVIVGTMDYLSPEQIAGKPVTARTDQYSLGCVVYETLTGSVPFVREDDAALLWAHLGEALPPISQARPDLPPAVQDVLVKATAKDPDNRYRSCDEFIAALTVALGAVGPALPPYRGDGPGAADARRPPRFDPADQQTTSAALTWRRAGRRILLGVLAGVLAVALAVTGYLVFTGRSGPTTRFTATDLVPFSFTYPADWHQAGAGTEVVFSPHAEGIQPFFAERGGADTWTEVRRLRQRDAPGTVGLFTTFSSGDTASRPIEEQRQSVQSYLPQPAEFTDAQSGLSLGGSTATRLDGDLRDQSDSSTRLRFRCYTLLIHRPQPSTVYLIFFSATQSFNDNQEIFDRIAASVDLPG